MEEPVFNSARSVEARVCMGLGRASLIKAHWQVPIDVLGHCDDHHLQLSMFQDNGMACYPEVWGAHRFEPIGSVFLNPARHVIHSKSSCIEQQAIVLNFSTEAVERWFEGRFDWTSRRLATCLDIGDVEIKRLLLHIRAELRNPSFASEALVELLAGQIAIALSRYIWDVEEQSVSGGLAPWRLRLIDEYLSEHAARASLSCLAKECHLSVRHLSRAFRISRGRSIGTYIAEFKIERARQLLAMGQPIKQVAAELGFSSPSNFSTAFLRATGESPRSFRLHSSRH